ncbi:response regulator transcription factor [Rothia sp. AR01]|uniref:Response regulator transcription factor n=1 Tax=Rothia santali TaxID=2949643 RepID=A0A9X2HB69_9MICC|nr:response regulator transcription factor [Rothia santali]MCP3424995.1 response regulator transcription factor [Rothia santali]
MIEVLIVDDQPLMAKALKVFVSGSEGMRVVGDASNGAEAIEQVRSLAPDVVVMDMQMPVMDGVEATRLITREFPRTRVLAVTTFSSEQYLVPALRAGASGYIVKDAEPDEVIAAIRGVNEGNGVIAPQVASDLIDAVRDASSGPLLPGMTVEHGLTERELAVVLSLAQGNSNAEIAAELYLAEATVKTHMGRVMDKWGVRDRVQVLIHAAQLGLVRIGV